jgi:NAD(P)-dependent dehydrogenase (short-subunit alcohol dehydrogenase family)
MLLANRVAIITGGARGIGRAIAILFAEEGATTVVVDIRADEAAETLKRIAGTKNKGLFVPCDVSNNSQVHDMVDRVITGFGKIDILVNNAAISPPENAIADITEEEWDRVLAINLKSVFLCCKAVLPYMKKQKYGKIVNVSSLGAISPAPFMADYAAAKSGVIALSRSLALESASYNICVNALLPGITRTDLHDAVIPPGMTKDEHFAGAAKMIPMKRVADPEDIAGAALFLASELSRYVTGDRILATGGLQ